MAGVTLLEVVFVLAVLALMSTLALPMILQATARVRVDLAAHEVLGTLRMARQLAIQHSSHVGVKFFEVANDDPREEGSAAVTFQLYLDGDGDGVRNDDLRSGVDPPLGPLRRLTHVGRFVRFGFPPDISPTHPSTGRALGRLEDPIRFNRSGIASFSPIGSATPGTVYLTDGTRFLVAVRVWNRSGRSGIVRFDPDRREWR